jgi:hypothetical protein
MNRTLTYPKFLDNAGFGIIRVIALRASPTCFPRTIDAIDVFCNYVKNLVETMWRFLGNSIHHGV